MTLPSTQSLLYIIAISGAVSWGITEIFKNAIIGLLQYHKIKHSPWWYNSVCRSLSIVIGYFAGLFFCSEDKMMCGLIGAACGTINAFLVMLIKRVLKRKAEQI